MNADCRLPLLSQGAKQGRVPCRELPEGTDVSKVWTYLEQLDDLTEFQGVDILNMHSWHLVQLSTYYFFLFLIYTSSVLLSHAKYFFNHVDVF